MDMILQALKEIRNLSESMSRDDFYNSEHLNINGSRKFTAYMGKISV